MMPNPEGRSKPGRKTILTDQRMERLAQLVEAGNYVDTACGVEGITDTTFYRWGRTGRDLIELHGFDLNEVLDMCPEDWPVELQGADALYERQCVRFVARMTKATATSEAFAVTTIRKAMPTNPVAAMMWLERRFPNKWRRRTSVEVSDGTEDGPAESERSMLQNPQAVAAMHEALALEAGEKDRIVDAEVMDAD